MLLVTSWLQLVYVAEGERWRSSSAMKATISEVSCDGVIDSGA